MPTKRVSLTVRGTTHEGIVKSIDLTAQLIASIAQQRLETLQKGWSTETYRYYLSLNENRPGMIVFVAPIESGGGPLDSPSSSTVLGCSNQKKAFTMLILSAAFLLLGNYRDATARLAGFCTLLFAGAVTFALAGVGIAAMLSAYPSSLRVRRRIWLQVHVITVAASLLFFMMGLVCWYLSRTYAT